MPPRSDSKFGRALFAIVASTPLGLLAQEVQESEEKLLGGNLAVEDGDAVGVHGAENGSCADQSTTKTAIPFGVSEKQGWKKNAFLERKNFRLID